MTHDPFSPRIPLLGYSDKLSGRPGDSIGFKVSSTAKEPFAARLVRIVCADPNPQGPRMIEEGVDAAFEGKYPSRVQPFFPGSYGVVDRGPEIAGGGMSLEITFWPTTPDKGPQTLFAAGGLSLGIDGGGHLAGSAGATTVTLPTRLKVRRWYQARLAYDPTVRILSLTLTPLQTANALPTSETVKLEGFAWSAKEPVTFAATLNDGLASRYFNGKLEAPSIHAGDRVVAAWDFSRETSSTRIVDGGPQTLHGRLVNLPARAMTGSRWDGSEMCWRHAPEHYGAIHFHDDDIYDFGWDDDFTFTIPEDLPSGIYAARISCGEYRDAMPFCVLPPKGKPRAKLCVLVSTITYAIYGNHARPDWEPSWKAVFAACHAYPWNPAEFPGVRLLDLQRAQRRLGRLPRLAPPAAVQPQARLPHLRLR